MCSSDLLRKAYGKDLVGDKAPIPAHLLGNMWAQEWANIYDLLEPYKGETSLDVTKKIKEKKLTVRDTIKIETGGKEYKVKKALVGIRDRFVIETDGSNLKAHGNIVDHEYEIERDGDKVAEVSKKWFRLRDTYGVEVDADVDPALILSITVAIDSFSHDHG